MLLELEESRRTRRMKDLTQEFSELKGEMKQELRGMKDYRQSVSSPQLITLLHLLLLIVLNSCLPKLFRQYFYLCALVKIGIKNTNLHAWELLCGFLLLLSTMSNRYQEQCFNI